MRSWIASLCRPNYTTRRAAVRDAMNLSSSTMGWGTYES